MAITDKIVRVCVLNWFSPSEDIPVFIYNTINNSNVICKTIFKHLKQLSLEALKPYILSWVNKIILKIY